MSFAPVGCSMPAGTVGVGAVVGPAEGPGVPVGPAVEQAARTRRRGAALLRREGAPERAPALPDVPGERETRPDGRPARVPCRRVQRLRQPGDGAVRPTDGPPGLLLELLRQGPRRADPGGRRARHFLTSPRVA